MDRTSFIARNQTGVPLPALMPSQTTMRMPTMRATSEAVMQSSGTSEELTPLDLVQRLPSIVNPVPADMSAQCDPFTAWVSANPMSAMLGLAVLGYFMLRRGK